MNLEVDLFFSFRSPYSYLAVPRLHDLARDYAVDIRVRPVLPIAVRDPSFFQRVNPLWPLYLLRDIRRVADFHGLDIAWPRPDPVVQDFTTGEIAEEQPYIYRLTRLGVAATQRGAGLPFIRVVSKLIWDGKTENWHQGDHLARASQHAGVDLAEIESTITANPTAHDAAIEENQKALEAAGHWGVPTMVFRGEPFFGQDRIDLLIWRLQQNGLERRMTA